MGVTLSGIFTGIESDRIISQLMEINSRPLYFLQAKKSLWAAKKSAIEEVQGRLEQLNTQLEALKNAPKLRTMAVSSSASSVLTASAEDGAGEGSHTIQVAQLAKAHRLVHTNGLDELGSLVGQGQLVYSYDGKERTILTTAQTTLENLRDLINNDAANPGVKASIMEYNSDYYLVMSGNDCGQDYAIQINFAQTSLEAFNEEAEWTTTQSPQNSKIRVDGFPLDSEAYIERSSNSISDVLSGVTLNLVNEGEAKITLTRNTDTVKSKLSSLVSAYNAMVDAVDKYTGYNDETKKAGILQGDSTLTGLLYQVRAVLTGRAQGFTEATDALTLPVQLGIKIDRYGKLSLEQTDLSAALSGNYNAAISLIAASASGCTTNEYVQFTSASETTTPGVYELRVNFSGSDVASAQIRTKGESLWRDLAVDGNRLTGQSGNPEQWLELNVNYNEELQNPLLLEVNVRQGFASTLYERLSAVLDPTSGSMVAKTDNYKSAISDLHDKIERMALRLDEQEKRLRAKYSRLEATLTRMDSQRAAIQSLVQTVEANQRAASGS